MNDLLIGCVGKPSAGKSTFLNAATDANAKVGNYPFTTIEPNHGVTHYLTECPCVKYNKQKECSPHYGKCENGTRWIPVKMLDVAGLVPGAAEGRGLGNKFLDDLRHADVLLHIVDVSGTTNEKGEATRGYDPINDIDWLTSEIHAWIHNNLWRKWDSIVRRHCATKSSTSSTLQAQLSGYGTREVTVIKVLDKLGLKEPIALEAWDQAAVAKFVTAFLKERFPTILVLNKIDSPDADKNIAKICAKYSPDDIVLSSALAECFLRKLRGQGFLGYQEGSDYVETHSENAKLKEMDEKTKERVEKLKDLVMLRFGGTGVHEVIRRAVEKSAGMVAVYPVKNIHNFTSNGAGAFRDCYLVRPGTTIREFARLLSPELAKFFAYAENTAGIQLSGDSVITKENNIIRIVTQATEVSS